MAEGISISIACGGCGYDLLGLSPLGVCPECGVAAARTVPACPRCMAEGFVRALRPLDPPGARAWTCGACAGVAYERDALREAASGFERPGPRSAGAVFDLTTALGVACTRCRTPMQSIVLDTHTLIDRCQGCGLIWVDAGELPALAEFVRRHLGDTRPPSNFEELLARPEELRSLAERAERRRETGESLRENAWWVAVFLSLFGW